MQQWKEKINRIMAGIKPTNSCKSLIKRSGVLTLTCKHTFSLINFTVNNQEHFQNNSALHNFNTRNRHDLYNPAARLSCFQKSAYNSGFKIFNTLPCCLRSLKNKKVKFKAALKRYLNAHSFYSVDEFLTLKMNHNVSSLK
jgi:hypothetical protein